MNDFRIAWWNSYRSICPEPPMDGFHFNYTPQIDINGQWSGLPDPTWIDHQRTLEYVGTVADMVMSGIVVSDAGTNYGLSMIDEYFSLGTYIEAPAYEIEATNYFNSLYGQLTPDKYPWVGAIMNFNSTNAGSRDVVSKIYYYGAPYFTQTYYGAYFSAKPLE